MPTATLTPLLQVVVVEEKKADAKAKAEAVVVAKKPEEDKKDKVGLLHTRQHKCTLCAWHPPFSESLRHWVPAGQANKHAHMQPGLHNKTSSSIRCHHLWFQCACGMGWQILTQPPSAAARMASLGASCVDAMGPCCMLFHQA